MRAYTPSVVHLSSVASKPPGENMRSGVPLPRTSYRVVMPSMTAVAMLLRRRFVAQRLDRVERVGAHVRVPLGAIVDRGREIADRRGHGSHAAVEPWPAAEA